MSKESNSDRAVSLRASGRLFHTAARAEQTNVHCCTSAAETEEHRGRTEQMMASWCDGDWPAKVGQIVIVVPARLHDDLHVHIVRLSPKSSDPYFVNLDSHLVYTSKTFYCVKTPNYQNSAL